MKKRVFDIIIASAGLVLFALPMVILYGLTRWKMGSPAIFRQKRLGKGRTPLTISKFRSLTNEVDSQGILLKDDLRRTPFGDFLRKTGYDELPQLWNVLKGEMSIVGPRPRAFSPINAEDHIMDPDILTVKPGMASPVKVEQLKRKGQLPLHEHNGIDAAYARGRVSLRKDFRIIAGTLPVFLGNNVHTYDKNQTHHPIESDMNRSADL
jgi:lipopolysaccharide/colanic/teichoic acid biosynthesis glycosyltransferase